MDIESAIREYLPEVVHMSLGTSRNNIPWVCEVHFSYDDDLNIYFMSLLSRRHSKEILDNPNVAGNIVVQHALDQKPRGVYFEGTAKLIEAEDEINEAFKVIDARFEIGDKVHEEAKSKGRDGHKVFKISVNIFYLFDARESSPSQKYELKWGK